jgi:hypothetical protein
VEKMRFSLKTSKLTYGLEIGRMVQSVIGDFIFTKSSQSSYFPYSRIVLVEIELIEGFP